MDNKEVTALVLLDLSKAFDSIDHSLLLTELSTLGLSKVSLEWFKSYLSQRGQSVRIGSQLSEPRMMAHGVPQGSIRGQAQFNIYILTIFHTFRTRAFWNRMLTILNRICHFRSRMRRMLQLAWMRICRG